MDSNKEVTDLMNSIFEDIVDVPGSRVDKTMNGVTVKGYWVGTVIRFDVKMGGR